MKPLTTLSLVLPKLSHPTTGCYSLHLQLQLALGPDVIRLQVIKITSPADLEIAFNILLLKGAVPQSWKTSRDLGTTTNWRPITIRSTVRKLLHRILVARIEATIYLNSSQHYFQEIDGTLANVFILDQY